MGGNGGMMGFGGSAPMGGDNYGMGGGGRGGYDEGKSKSALQRVNNSINIIGFSNRLWSFWSTVRIWLWSELWFIVRWWPYAPWRWRPRRQWRCTLWARWGPWRWQRWWIPWSQSTIKRTIIYMSTFFFFSFYMSVFTCVCACVCMCKYLHSEQHKENGCVSFIFF